MRLRRCVGCGRGRLQACAHVNYKASHTSQNISQSLSLISRTLMAAQQQPIQQIAAQMHRTLKACSYPPPMAVVMRSTAMSHASIRLRMKPHLVAAQPTSTSDIAS
eukprot:1125945-Rhodomonas_salina.1